jgi:hypothetical protein
MAIYHDKLFRAFEDPELKIPHRTITPEMNRAATKLALFILLPDEIIPNIEKGLTMGVPLEEIAKTYKVDPVMISMRLGIPLD